ncbi:Transmembrane protein 106C [Myotis davidii]|uniref:Transmembrane protein 106C n=1 Tax=Myotis davidii TaxID=225400 RepID=L5MDB8_MYODS|nr:Transmembrane protein 106C [Myotis davidii]
MGSQHSASARPPSHKRKKDDRVDMLDEREQEEAIAQFPYVEFTGRDSITCLTCQGTGYIPTVLVDDDGIRMMNVTFNKQDSLVILAIKATLKIRNSNFYSVAVTSLSSQVQYMNTVVGSYMTTNVSLIPPRSEQLVDFLVQAEMGGPFSYVYFFCTLPDIQVHNIVIFMRTSVKISYIGHMTQSSLETHHYVDCGTNVSAV